MKRCLYCYGSLEDNEVDYHSKCARKIFQSSTQPLITYTIDEIEKLAYEVIQSKITLTGVQPKLSLNIESKKNEPKRFTIVGLWGNYILKPQTSQYALLPENEDLSMHLAEIAKIKTVPHSLIRFQDGSLAYITKRIDRDKKGEKIAMEDMCQLTERQTEYKYKGSYEQIAKKIKEYSGNPLLDIISFFEVVLFSYLTGNSDMHLKNFSLYNNNEKQELTPAYDLVSTKLVMPDDKEDLALTLNSKKSNIKRKDFDNLLEKYKIEPKTIENIYNKFRKTIPKWVEFIDKSFLSEEQKTNYKELIIKNSKILD